MEISLIYPSAEAEKRGFLAENKPNISKETVEQLGLFSIFELKNSNICDYFTTDPAVTEYRRAAFSDMMKFPQLASTLESAFPILNDIAELRRLDADSSGTTESYLFSITEVELYISCIDKLREGFAPLDGKLESEAFRALTGRIAELADSDYYKELNKKLSEMTERVRDVKSVTIGVNLDGQLRPSDAGVLSINGEYFHAGDVIEKILRMNFKDDEYTCIAPLVPFAKGQTENTQLAMSYAFNSAINEVFKSSVRSWKKIVQSYVLDNTDFLLRMMPEIEFMIRGTAALSALAAKGCPLTAPELADADECAFAAYGLYNPSVALQIEDSIVKNDIVFDEHGRIFVLTGPNRGGKSVITCAVGLAQAMVQLGMPAPADKIKISPADGIFVHFPTGSEDTIDKGRLGEECVRLGVIFDAVTKHSLVLLDESLSSTGAYEASYIAAELLAAFSKVGCRTLFSTHLHELAAAIDSINEKARAEGGAAVDSLVARITDGKRSFKIERAKPDGRSYARDIAEKYGVSYEKIIDKINHRNNGGK